MRAGFGRLRLSPDEFWAMTPRELFHATGGGRANGSGPPGRAELAALMARFPDT